MTAADLEAWAKKYREAVEPHLGEEDLEAVGAFERTLMGSETETVVGVIRWLYEQCGGKGRVGKLPSSFLLAVTGDKVRAFGYRQRGSNLKIRNQLAIFDRDEIAFDYTEEYPWDSVYLQVTEGGRTHQIAIDVKVLEKKAGAADVLAALKR